MMILIDWVLQIMVLIMLILGLIWCLLDFICSFIEDDE